ncbi:hypothetical protein GCM10023260_13670 [Bartonella acomydis]|uniref:Uncharacterized protein n=1 Tax=Bartonella acomydis TaxID=686234 RepID=A0ABP9MUA7_9HYPH
MLPLHCKDIVIDVFESYEAKLKEGSKNTRFFFNIILKDAIYAF